MQNLILTLDQSYTPHRWMRWEDVVTLKCKGLIYAELGDVTNIKLGGISRMTGLRSEVEIAPIVVVRGKFKYDARVPPLTNISMYRRDQHQCGYCGRVYREDKLSRDHIIPISRGGPNIWTNVITSCKTCNREKDSFLLEEIGWKLLYVPYVPNNYEKLILSNRNILPVQRTFLEDFLPKHSRLFFRK